MEEDVMPGQLAIPHSSLRIVDSKFDPDKVESNIDIESKECSPQRKWKGDNSVSENGTLAVFSTVNLKLKMRKRRIKPSQEALEWIKKDKDPEGFMVEDYGLKGRGVKTIVQRRKGNFLLHYAGETIPAATGEEREEEHSTGFRFFFRDHKGHNLCVDASEETSRLGRLVNHGSKKEVNAVMKSVEGYLVLFAIRDIHPGEELLYDYGLDDLPWIKILDLNDGEVQWLSSHLAHTVKTHKDFYRLQSAAVEIGKVSKLLLLTENGDVSKFRGKSLEEIQIDDSVAFDKGDIDEEKGLYDIAEEDSLDEELTQDERSETNPLSHGGSMKCPRNSQCLNAESKVCPKNSPHPHELNLNDEHLETNIPSHAGGEKQRQRNSHCLPVGRVKCPRKSPQPRELNLSDEHSETNLLCHGGGRETPKKQSTPSVGESEAPKKKSTPS